MNDNQRCIELLEDSMKYIVKIVDLNGKLKIAVDALEYYANRNGEGDNPIVAQEALSKIKGDAK